MRVDRPHSAFQGGQGWIGGRRPCPRPVPPRSDPIHRLAPEHRSRRPRFQQVVGGRPAAAGGPDQRRSGPASKRWPATRGRPCHRRKASPRRKALSLKGGLSAVGRPATKGSFATKRRLTAKARYPPLAVCQTTAGRHLLTLAGSQTWAWPPNEGLSAKEFCRRRVFRRRVAKSRLAVGRLRRRLVCRRNRRAGATPASPGSPGRGDLPASNACRCPRPVPTASSRFPLRRLPLNLTNPQWGDPAHLSLLGPLNATVLPPRGAGPGAITVLSPQACGAQSWGHGRSGKGSGPGCSS